MAMIDYGSVVFKNGKRYKENKMFPEIDELGLVFYKTHLETIDNGTTVKYFGFDNKKSYRFLVDNNFYWVKEICSRVYKCEIKTPTDTWNIIFGYGVDGSKEIWDKIKKIYLGKKNASKVDKELNKYDWR